MNTLTNFDFVLFGATGDLAMRKLIPSLYQAHAAGLLHPKGRILVVSRSDFIAEDFYWQKNVSAFYSNCVVRLPDSNKQ